MCLGLILLLHHCHPIHFDFVLPENQPKSSSKTLDMGETQWQISTDSLCGIGAIDVAISWTLKENYICGDGLNRKNKNKNAWGNGLGCLDVSMRTKRSHGSKSPQLTSLQLIISNMTSPYPFSIIIAYALLRKLLSQG